MVFEGALSQRNDVVELLALMMHDVRRPAYRPLVTKSMMPIEAEVHPEKEQECDGPLRGGRPGDEIEDAEMLVDGDVCPEDESLDDDLRHPVDHPTREIA